MNRDHKNRLVKQIDASFSAAKRDLIEFLTIPSISTAPEYAPDVIKCAAYVENQFKKLGLHDVRQVETKGHPICFAATKHDPSKPTLLIYGHYDVQPPEPLDLWDSPPFSPTEVNGQIVARGASDDKGQVMCHLKAFEAWQQSGEELPINVKFLIEGEEEVGSPNLEPFIASHQELLACDAVVISDTPMLKKDTPSICTSLRGLVYTELTVETATTDLHSGQHGGPAPNAIDHLVRIIGSLKGADGKVNIPGFYDHMPNLSEEDVAQLSDMSPSDDTYKASSGVYRVDGESDKGIFEKQWYRPTLDCNGIWGGYIQEGAKTVIPRKATAKISMRLVGEQDPAFIFKQLQDYVKSIGPDGVKLSVKEIAHSGHPISTNKQSRAVLAAASAIQDVHGKEPVFQGEGGSIPIVSVLQDKLEAPVVLLGFNLPEDKIHAPNEQFSVENFNNGIKVSALFYHHFGAIHT